MYELPDRPVIVQQLNEEIQELGLDGFIGCRRQPFRWVEATDDEPRHRKPVTPFITVKFNRELSPAEKSNIRAVVEAHIPIPTELNSVISGSA